MVVETLVYAVTWTNTDFVKRRFKSPGLAPHYIYLRHCNNI